MTHAQQIAQPATAAAHLVNSSFPPLHRETRTALPTTEAAHFLNRKPQTLRAWACLGGPISPIRINGRLAWKVSDIQTLLGEVS